ncbi:MAG: anthranilate synthase component I family protein [Armatimonadota bacterium]
MDSERLATLASEPGAALMSGDGTWCEGAAAVLLQAPTEVMVARVAHEVEGLLERIEGLRQEGYWVAGYLAYEAGAAFGLATHPPAGELPLAWMAAYPPEHVERLPLSALRPGQGPPDLSATDVELSMTAGQYMAAVARIKKLIAAGDTYQVNLTCRARLRGPQDPFGYFLWMVHTHPVPYAAWLNLGDAQVLSLSPELLLRRRGGMLLSKPMKGTRPRGRTPDEDEALARELVASAKDCAENLMIVDMVRNDLGRVCRIGSVEVPELFAAERYRSVWQMTSSVSGVVRENASLREVFAAVFPGASVTGAPKHRTMQIIRELEPEPRGVYCGAIGLFAPASVRGADFTCSLPIRTLVHRAGSYLLGIGAGIVWDSDPARSTMRPC